MTAGPASGGAFEQLHPSLQHHVVNTLGWRELRPLQDRAVAPVLAGDHCLLLAPTAGGKTEAGLFPVLTRIANERQPPLSTLYLCPLRALLNNLYPRLERYVAFTGHRVGLWHGDVGQAHRRRLTVEPPDVLLTTPESLEAILISARVDGASLFAQLRTVIVDEAHAFAGDDRGWHLLAVLARLERIAGRPLQRIGLSATVGNPEGLLAWLAPGAGGGRTVVAPGMGPTLPGGAAARAAAPRARPAGPGPGSGPEADVTIDYVGSLVNAATVIAGLHRGEKRLVFVDSRQRVEELTRELRARGITTYLTHASLSRDQRRHAEQAFAEGADCVIVATSALELGLDIGDLDRVIQVDAPSTVASFLQRLGRSGRRAGTTRNALFLTTRPEALWRACGITRLWRAGHVEPVVPPPLPAHLLAHQLLALALQEGAIGAREWAGRLGDPPVFGPDVALLDDAVADHLTGQGWLHVDQGMLSVGREAEARWGRRNFMELTSVFTSPPIFTVVAGRREIGHVHDLGLVAAFRTRDGPPVLLLGGRGWRILDVDWRRRKVQVELTDRRGRVRYHGTTLVLARALCRAIGDVLAGEGPGVALTRRAQDTLDAGREGFPGLRPGDATYLHHEAGGATRWWTFAGLRANLELAARLGSLAPGGASTLDDLSISLADDTRPDELRSALDLATPVEDLLDLAEDVTAGIKFADCIPAWLADTITLARFTDPATVGAIATAPITTGHSHPSG